MDYDWDFSENQLTTEAELEKVLQVYKTLNQNEAQTSAIRKSLKGALEHPQLQRYFRYNVSGYCQVLSILITESTNIEELITMLKDVQTFPKLLIERDDFYSYFLDDILKPLILSVIKFKNDPQITENVCKVIQKCTFVKKFKSFECFLSDHSKNTTKCRDKHFICKSLMKYLEKSYNFEDTEEFLVTYRLIFQSFCIAYNNPNLTYRMLVVLVTILGFNVEKSFEEYKLIIKFRGNKNLSLEKSLKILRELFEIVATSQSDPELKIYETSFTNFLQNFLKSLLVQMKCLDENIFKILEATIEINPLIIESMITEIIIYVMLSYKNPDLISEYEGLIVKIMQVFAKLHRIQNFISKFIPTIQSHHKSDEKYEVMYEFRGKSKQIQRSSISDVNSILPLKVLNYFTDCVANLASWQVMNLCKTLLFHLNKAVDDLPQSSEESNDFYLEILSTLTCWLLQSVRMAEHTVASNVVQKFVASLNELSTVLGKFGSHLLQRKHNTTLMKSFLNTSYNWAEIYMVMAYYSINDEVKFTTTTDNDFAACNLTYLHSYLTGEQWCLISERITNFGEEPCKELMQKLFIQKLRTTIIFEKEMSAEMANPVIKAICAPLDDGAYLNVFLDKFVINNLLPKSPNSFILALSEKMLKNVIDGKLDLDIHSEVLDSALITNGILSTIALKIHKLLKQKRKLDEGTLKKPTFSKIVEILPSEVFLEGNIGSYLQKSAEFLTSLEDKPTLDIKVNSSKIIDVLNVLKKLPVIYCTEDIQKLLTLLLFSLQIDLNASNIEPELKSTCENLIIGICQENKFTFLDIFDPITLIEAILSNFDRSKELSTSICEHIFKDDAAIEAFKPAVLHLKDNLKIEKCLKCSIVILNLLAKTKRSKLSNESKAVCSELKSNLCHKFVKIIAKRSPNDYLLEPCAIAIKHYLGINQEECEDLKSLKRKLSDYLEFVFNDLNQDNLKGGLILFTTILHNKASFDDVIGADFILKVWNCLKTVTISDDHREDYFQLIILLTALIPNEDFSNISQDLLKFTEKAISDENYEEFVKQIKTWTGIISSNFNSTKTKVLHTELESLLQNLSLILKFKTFNENLFETVVSFEVSMIQNAQFLLTPSMVELFLLNVTLLMTKEIDSADFVKIFNLSMSILENLLKHRNPLVMDRLPPYLQEYRIILKKLCQRGDSNLNLEQRDVQKIADCAHRLEKLTKNLVVNSKDLMRISPYLIADILAQYELVTLYPNVKLHLNNCIYSFISLCDQHAVPFLMRVLSNASTEIFKIMYDNYKKYYRFTGKV